MAAKITNFFERVDEPLPIRWTPSAEPLSKKPRRGPGTLEHSIPLEQISFFPNLHWKPSPPFGLRKLMALTGRSHKLAQAERWRWLPVEIREE